MFAYDSKIRVARPRPPATSVLPGGLGGRGTAPPAPSGGRTRIWRGPAIAVVRAMAAAFALGLAGLPLAIVAPAQSAQEAVAPAADTALEAVGLPEGAASERPGPAQEPAVDTAAVAEMPGVETAGADAERAAAGEEPASILDEVSLAAYVENSGVLNLAGESPADELNELRIYDFESDVSFNMAELSVKKDPSEPRPYGFGMVLTAGRDAQKNHVLGLFRDEDDVFPFEDTPEFDIQELYGSARAPIGNGLTLKAGKFVTLLGYEVIESPLNLNTSRSLLFVYSIPLTHVGGLLTYPISPRVSVTAGPVIGWDVLDDNNEDLTWMGQLATTPAEGLLANLQFIVGPEQFDTSEVRWVADLVLTYTGVDRLTLGLNSDVGREEDEASLVAAGLAEADASWWGTAAYAAYDLTDRLRAATRVEYFQDTDGVRTLALGPGQQVNLWEATATLQYNVWKGLFGRVEYRHDEADENIFDLDEGGVATADSQDTMGLSLYYTFF